jgi:hypothetical protein
MEKYGGHEETRTPNLYRVKHFVGWIVAMIEEKGTFVLRKYKATGPKWNCNPASCPTDRQLNQ